MVATNVLGIMNLMDACLASGFDAFVNTGSSSEYGFTDHAFSKDDPVAPNSHYAGTKALATLYCRDIAHRHWVHTPTLRLYSAYGPFEDPGHLIPRLILDSLRGRLPPLASPDTARDFVYVDERQRRLRGGRVGAAGRRGPVYNVGTGQQTTLREVVAIACRALDIHEVPRWESMPPRAWDTTIWRVDVRRIRERLGWTPRHTFVEGLRRAIEWLRAHPVYRERYEEAVR
jgi:UDP-glucose 4-epimerase